MNDLPRRPPAGVGARGLLDRPRELLSKLKPITRFALNFKKCDFNVVSFGAQSPNGYGA
jgi:hypothetical protein